MGHRRIRATLRSTCVRMALAVALILYAGAAIALDGAVQSKATQVHASPLLLAQADTSSCNRGISTTGANLLFTQASMKYREAEAAPLDDRLPLYGEVLKLLDTIVRDYPHTDLACRINTEGSLGRMNVAEMRQVVSEATNATLRYPVAGMPPSVSASFYDETYPNAWSPPAQHLGVDLPTPLGTTVISPVTGTVVSNNTAVAEPFNKRIVIRDERTGYEHVLGHLASNLATGQAVAIGDPVGEIVAAGTGPHVHWGVNVSGVEAAINVPGGWGWGRGPLRSTRDQAKARGWLDPLSLEPQTGTHPDPGLVVRNAESSGAPAAPNPAVDDAQLPAPTSLQYQFPETYAAIWEIPSGSNVAKETAITALETLVTLAYSPEMNDLMWSRLGVNAADLVGWATKNPERAVALSIENVGSNLAVSAAVSVSAALVADSLFATQPMASVPQSWQNPLKALVRATIIEIAGLAQASSNPAAVVGPLVNRLIDVVEIYQASSALTKVIDQALVATALGLETAAQLAVDFPNARSQRVAEDTVADLLGGVREFVGKDDEAAVQEIGDLAYTALISQRRGDLQTAQELVVQIQREGKLSSNIHPFSAITKPVDWLTAVARGGRDTPEQAANIIITATALRELLAGSLAIKDCERQFITVSVGESKCGYSLGSDGIVKFHEKNVFRFDQVSADIGYHYNNGERVPAGTNTRIKLFPQSPSGRFHIINACHYECGDLRLFDSHLRTTHKVHAGHYGPDNWIEWSEAENYALLYSYNEEVYWLHIVDTVNSASYSYPEGRGHLSSIALEEVEWVGPERFTAAINGEPKSVFLIAGSSIIKTVFADSSDLELVQGPERFDYALPFPTKQTFLLGPRQARYDENGCRFQLPIGIYVKEFTSNPESVIPINKVLWTGLCSPVQEASQEPYPEGSGTLTLLGSDGLLLLRLDVGLYREVLWSNGALYWNSDLTVDYQLRAPFRYSAFGRYGKIDVYIPDGINLNNEPAINLLTTQAFNYFAHHGGFTDKNATRSGVEVAIFFEKDRNRNVFASANYRFDQDGQRIEARWSDNKTLDKFKDEQRSSLQAAQRLARQRASDQEKARIAALRASREQTWAERWRMQFEVEVPLENITDLMRFDKAATIAELSKGRHITLTYRSRNVEFAQGKAMLSDHQRGTDIYEGIPDGGFSWEGWFDAMSAAQNRSFTVVCRLDADALVGLREGPGNVFYAQLNSVTDSNYMSQVVLDCAR
jgi:murein DD-endopeptidase MepM/ murein hydrolase activator NlpD